MPYHSLVAVPGGADPPHLRTSSAITHQPGAGVKRYVTDPRLTANLSDRRPVLRLPQHIGDVSSPNLVFCLSISAWPGRLR